MYRESFVWNDKFSNPSFQQGGMNFQNYQGSKNLNQPSLVESTFFQAFPSQASQPGGFSNEFLDFSNFNNKPSPNRNPSNANNNFNNSSPYGIDNNLNKMQNNFTGNNANNPNNAFSAPQNSNFSQMSKNYSWILIIIFLFYDR